MTRLCLLLAILTLVGGASTAQTSRAAADYTKRAIASYAHGDLDEAIADFGVAIVFDPSYLLAFFNRGRAQHDKGNLDEAISDYTKAIALDARSAPAYNNRCAALQQKGDATGAQRIATKQLN